MKYIHDENNEGFPCPECSFKSKYRSHLKKHIDSIHLHIIFKCPDCDLNLSSKKSLQLHISTIHYGEKKYSCPECNHKSAQTGSLKAHINSIHRSQIFSCSICDYEATSKKYLLKHIQRGHIHDKKT